MTADFRDAFAEILEKRMGIANLALVFPGYAIDTKQRLRHHRLIVETA